MFLNIIFVFFSVILISNSAMAQGIQKGLWEITTETVMEGVAMKIPPITNQVCVTSDKYIPNEPDKNSNCKMINTKHDGNTVTWKAVCKEKGANIESTGKMVYSGNTFTGDVYTAMTEEGNKINTTMKMKGKYLGPCK